MGRNYYDELFEVLEPLEKDTRTPLQKKRDAEAAAREEAASKAAWQEHCRKELEKQEIQRLKEAARWRNKYFLTPIKNWYSNSAFSPGNKFFNNGFGLLLKPFYTGALIGLTSGITSFTACSAIGATIQTSAAAAIIYSAFGALFSTFASAVYTVSDKLSSKYDWQNDEVIPAILLGLGCFCGFTKGEKSMLFQAPVEFLKATSQLYDEVIEERSAKNLREWRESQEREKALEKFAPKNDGASATKSDPNAPKFVEKLAKPNSRAILDKVFAEVAQENSFTNRLDKQKQVQTTTKSGRAA